MKKYLIIISMLFSSFFSAAHAAETVKKNNWYIGTNAGWIQTNTILDKLDGSNLLNILKFLEKIENLNFGIYAGYKVNPYFSLQIDSNVSASIPNSFSLSYPNISFYNTEYTAKLSYPLNNLLKMYTRLGASLESKDIEKNLENSIKEFCKYQVSPVVAYGLEYDLDKNFKLQLDYNLKGSDSNFFDSASFTPTLNGMNLGISWHFSSEEGKSADVLNKIIEKYDDNVEPQVSPELQKKISDIKKNVFFPSNSSTLPPSAHETLTRIINIIKSSNEKNILIIVTGHIDNVESEEGNFKLSEERAFAVAKFLLEHGISRHNIIFKGCGNKKKLSEKSCENVKNKKVLKACYSPDRRAEISVWQIQ